MDTSKRRFIRLAIVSAAAAGVALASPAIAVADESEVIEAAPIDENSDPPVAVLTTEPLVIELVVEGDPPTESTESTEGAQPEESAGDDAALTTSESTDTQSENLAEQDTMPTATESEPTSAEPSPAVAALAADSGEDHSGGTGEDHSGGTGEDHSGGTGEDHSGGTGGEHTGGGGTGDPYVMTFEVSWQFPDGSTIPVLDGVLPTDWQSIFDLAAASATGGGKPTSAHCTYSDDSTDLVCEFENPGKHSSITDGMVVPAKPTATYSVTVLWPISGWTIEGANDGPYSARDLCPRGGHGSDSGHDGGHDSGHVEALEADVPEGSGTVCVHTVVMRQPLVTPEPPPVEPPAEVPPVAEVPAAPPPSQTPVSPEVAPTTPTADVLPATVTPRALPATGNTATTTLMIGTIIFALGGCLSVLARRRNDLPLG
jgi:LPXTG-motif cell wall-anchored protein